MIYFLCVIEETIKNLSRLREITAVVVRHGLGHYLERRKAKRIFSAQEAALQDALLEAGARRFRAVLEELGPAFIKFGQILSTRADLLPQGFIAHLSNLQDACAPMPYHEVCAMVEKGLGKPLSALFSQFEEKPLASASIAQVHRAFTLQGEEVAVKVQRPHVREQMVQDLDLLGFLAQLVDSMVEESGLVTSRGVVAEFETALLKELDFEHEARMMQRFAKNLEGKNRPYVVPRVHPSLSCATVLTMEFMRGTRLSELDASFDKKKIASNIIHAAFEQLFTDGLFHADPHPGNSFILPDNRMVLMDFGSVGEISYAMRETLVVLVVSCGMRDADAVARLLYRVGIPEERILLHRLRDAVASLFNDYLGEHTAISQVHATQLLRALFDLASRFRVRIPSEYALVARASMTVEGVIRQLDPDLEVLQTVQPVVKNLIEERFALQDMGQGTLKQLLLARDVVREFPMMASQILMDLEAGKLRVQVEHPKIETIARNIDALGLTVFMGLVACGLIMGALSLLGQYQWTLWGVPAVPAVALWMASMLFGVALGRYYVSPKIKKISLGKWMLKRRKSG